MGRFDEQVAAVGAHLGAGLREGRIRELAPAAPSSWPAGRSFVLARDTALDLGSPAVGSVGFLVWAAPDADSPPTDRVFLEGPDVATLASQRAGPVPFGQVILVRGELAADYDCYLALKQALSDLTLEGIALRSQPSQNHLWCRIHTDAVARGFDFAHLGAGLIAGLRGLDFVTQVDLLFHTAGRDELAPLAEIAEGSARVVGALIKRHEEEQTECDDCEYASICDEREHGSEGAAS